jgi:hypothetical protein
MNGISAKLNHGKYRFLAPAARNIFLSAIVIFLVFSICACDTLSGLKRSVVNRFSAEDDMDEAIEAVNEFIDLLSEKDFEEAYDYLSSKDKLRGSEEDFYNEFKNVTDIVSIDVKWVEVKNNIAVVCIDLTDFYDGEEKVFEDIEVSLVREDEEWKIAFWE